MRDLFETIKAGGVSEIERLVNERQPESVDLEFKTKQDATKGEASKDDKNTLGRALSALANSAGGLLVWGVEAAKGPDDIDCATAPKPITNVERFRSDIQRLAAQALMPKHDGIHVHPIPLGDGTGYLLVYVERSERRPHQCQYGQKAYYKRSLDNSFAMEHYDIEDAFKRQTVATLEARIELRSGGYNNGPQGTHHRVILEIHLMNASMITARYPYLIIESVEGVRQDRLNPLGPRSGFSNAQLGKMVGQVADSNQVVHPGLALAVCAYIVDILGDRDGQEFIIRRPEFSEVTIKYRCGCENSRQLTGTLTKTFADFVAAIPGGYWGA